ncbi:MAG: ArsI/CadI family heavy metal resistance metalloenzyme [Pseudomonadota bacterium]
MNRLHLHIAVDDINQSIGFYTALFGTEPTVTKDDYAKWMLDDPAVNFAISDRVTGKTGVDHVGIQTDSRDGLDAITARLHAAEQAMLQQEATTCCYAESDKTWVEDPSGVRWETFYTHGEAAVYGADATGALEYKPRPSARAGSSCC